MRTSGVIVIVALFFAQPAVGNESRLALQTYLALRDRAAMRQGGEQAVEGAKRAFLRAINDAAPDHRPRARRAARQAIIMGLIDPAELKASWLQEGDELAGAIAFRRADARDKPDIAKRVRELSPDMSENAALHLAEAMAWEQDDVDRSREAYGFVSLLSPASELEERALFHRLQTPQKLWGSSDLERLARRYFLFYRQGPRAEQVRDTLKSFAIQMLQDNGGLSSDPLRRVFFGWGEEDWRLACLVVARKALTQSQWIVAEAHAAEALRGADAGSETGKRAMLYALAAAKPSAKWIDASSMKFDSAQDQELARALARAVLDLDEFRAELGRRMDGPASSPAGLPNVETELIRRVNDQLKLVDELMESLPK